MDKKARKKLNRYLFMAVAILILIPVVLDRFFAHRLYMIWCQWGIRSSMSERDWFSFLGSYFGVVGTIFMGIVAYWQTYIINRQSEEYNKLQKTVTRMQKEISVFRIHPIIHFKETSIKVRNDSRQPCTIQKELRDYYYTIYGREQDKVGTRYIVFEIIFEDKGVIPAVQCEIFSLEWEIAGIRYCIDMDESKKKINSNDKVYVLIDENDISGHCDTFFDALDLHEHYVNSGTYGYMTSTMRMGLCFTNQKGYHQSYKLSYKIKGTEEGLKVNALFFEREGDADGTE